MIEIGIVGRKDSGKTTLVEKLLPLFLKSGVTVATIKHTSHRHLFDRPGKDSFRHREAGACATLAQSESDFALYMPPTDDNFRKAHVLLSAVCDLCLVEGDKTADRPKVLLTRFAKKEILDTCENVIATYGPGEGKSGMLHFACGSEAVLVEYLIIQYHLLKGEASRAV